jgi:hypothetical protein
MGVLAKMNKVRFIVFTILYHMVIFSLFCEAVFLALPSVAYAEACPPGEYCWMAVEKNEWRDGYPDVPGCFMKGCKGIVSPGGQGCCGHPNEKNVAWECIVGHPYHHKRASDRKPNFDLANVEWCVATGSRVPACIGCDYHPGCIRHYCLCLDPIHGGNTTPNFWHNAHVGGPCKYTEDGGKKEYSYDQHPRNQTQKVHPTIMKCQYCRYKTQEVPNTGVYMKLEYEEQHPHKAYLHCPECNENFPLPGRDAITDGVCRFDFADVLGKTSEEYSSMTHPHYYDKICNFRGCDYTRSASDPAHKYPWKETLSWEEENNTSHVKYCMTCDYVVRREPHGNFSYRDTGDDEYHLKECGANGCEFTADEQHSPSSGWQYNNTEHYRICTLCHL